MAPQADQDLVIIRLSFFPYEHPDNPRIFMQRKQHSPSAAMAHIRDWYSRALSKETAKLTANNSITFNEWNISSSDVTLFMIDGHRYDSVLLVLGEEAAHWVFYKNMSLRRRLEGSAVLPVNYCSCCIDKQYLSIMEAVKSFSNQHGVYH